MKPAASSSRGGFGHACIAEAALADLTGERCTIFARVIDDLKREDQAHPALLRTPNLVWMTLAAIMPLAPISPGAKTLRLELLAFVDQNATKLNRALLERSGYYQSFRPFRKAAGALVDQLVARELQRYARGELIETSDDAYRISSEAEDFFFPYADDELVAA